MDREMPMTLEKVSWIAAAIGAVAAVFFGIQSVNANKALAELQAELVRLEQNSASFDAGFDAGNLVLSSDSSAFVEPDKVYVTPVFANAAGAPIVGERVDFPVNSGLVLVSERTVTFNDLKGRICAYGKNRGLCSSSQNSLETVIVTLEVNGQIDTDPIQFAF